jgi:hypothetical protein
LNLQTEEKHCAVSKNVGNRDVIGRYVDEMKVSIIEGTDITKEQDKNVQEEADNHNVNETGKDKQTGRSTRHGVIFCAEGKYR